jgi:hypothetical protein
MATKSKVALYKQEINFDEMKLEELYDLYHQVVWDINTEMTKIIQNNSLNPQRRIRRYFTLLRMICNKINKLLIKELKLKTKKLYAN